MGFVAYLSYNTLMQDDDQNDPQANGSGQDLPPQDPSEPDEDSIEQAGESLTWNASEYVAHNKGFSWFLGLAVLIIGIAVGVYFLVHSIFSSVMILLIGVAFGIAGGRQPRVLEYMVSGKGVQIGKRFHPYSDFKSFSVVLDGGLKSIVLLPLKRLVPPINVYYEPPDEEKIVEIIGEHLPQEDGHKDYVEQLMRRMKF